MMLKLIFSVVLVYLSIGFLNVAKSDQVFNETYAEETDNLFDETEMFFDKEEDVQEFQDLNEDKPATTSFWNEHVFDPMRISLGHEFSYKIKSPDRILKNRSSLRIEYSKHFFNNFFTLIDLKAMNFWGDDHRAKSGESSETKAIQAYIEASINETNIRLGIQTIAWGESQIGTITDVISPRDNRELFSIELEDLRIGQPMLSIDQYSTFGRWTFLFIPDSDFDENPEKGAAFYIDPFNGAVNSQTKIKNITNIKDHEYGMRWKQTFGKSDISFMTARLIDNQYLSEFSIQDNAGLITQSKSRFSMAGMTFNYAINEFLIRGEVATKFPQVYRNTLSQIVKKDAVDMSLGFDYSPDTTLTLSLEVINNHILNWDSDLQVEKNSYSLAMGMTKLLMYDDLSLNWLNIYNRVNKSFLSLLFASYELDDQMAIELNLAAPFADDWVFRDQKQVDFQIRYQF